MPELAKSQSGTRSSDGPDVQCVLLYWALRTLTPLVRGQGFLYGHFCNDVESILFAGLEDYRGGDKSERDLRDGKDLKGHEDNYEYIS